MALNLISVDKVSRLSAGPELRAPNRRIGYFGRRN
jgi:hypothetical protein